MIVRLCSALIAVAFLLSPRVAEAQCVYSVSPLSQSVPSTGFVNASISVITGSSCAWTGTSSVSWITIPSGTHTGLGSVNYTVAANSTSTARTGTLTVAGQTVTITQAFGSCTYSVSPTSSTVPLSGFINASISVITGSSCTWTATSSVSWITITSGASGTGLASATYTVAPATFLRTGTLTVAGQTVTITQGDPLPAPTGVRIVR